MALSRSAQLRWLVSSCSILVAGLVFSATLSPGSTSSSASSIVNLALYVSLACYLLLPGANNLVVIVANSSIGIALFVILSQLPVATGMPITILLRVCVVVFCLGMLLWSLTQLFEILFPDSKSVRINILLLVAIITSAPVWLGPVVDIYQPQNAFINGVISITPLTHFSVATEYDYLRSEWLYQNSAFGSLPFVYPSFNGITVCYLLFVLILRFILWGVTRQRKIQKSLHRPRANHN